MKKLFILFFLIINCSFVFCAKYKIEGTDYYKLDNEIELDFWYNIDKYETGNFTVSKDNHITCFWKEIYSDETVVYFCTNSGKEKVINKILCTFNENKSNDILKLLKKYHNLESTDKTDTYTEYTYNDSITNNKAVARKYKNKVELTYISGTYKDKTYIDNESDYSIIKGTDDFYLCMTKNEAIKIASQKKYEKLYECDTNGINRIWFKKLTSNSDYWLEQIIKTKGPVYVDSENYFCLDFIQKNNEYILSNYYTTIILKTELYSSQSVFSDFITAMMKKYKLLNVNTTIIQKNNEQKIFRFGNFNNDNYLIIQYSYIPHSPTEEIVLRIEYGIPVDKNGIQQKKSNDQVKTAVDLL